MAGLNDCACRRGSVGRQTQVKPEEGCRICRIRCDSRSTAPTCWRRPCRAFRRRRHRRSRCRGSDCPRRNRSPRRCRRSGCPTGQRTGFSRARLTSSPGNSRGQNRGKGWSASLMIPSSCNSDQRLTSPFMNPRPCTASSTPSLLKSSSLPSQAQPLRARPSDSDASTYGAVPLASFAATGPLLRNTSWPSPNASGTVMLLTKISGIAVAVEIGEIDAHALERVRARAPWRAACRATSRLERARSACGLA